MALDFPQAPSFGDIYGQWRWDGNKWAAAPVTGADAPGDGFLYGRFNNTWQRAAPLTSPALAGIPTAVAVVPPGDASQRLATTAWVVDIVTVIDCGTY